MKDFKNQMPIPNPNDDSFGGYYAPMENGKVNEKKKKYIREGDPIPEGWVLVEN